MLKKCIILFLLCCVSGCGYGHLPDVVTIGANLGRAEYTISGLPNVNSYGYFIAGVWYRERPRNDQKSIDNVESDENN